MTKYAPAADSATWQPPAGMVKAICQWCNKPFASRGDVSCPSCKTKPVTHPKQGRTPRR